MIWGIVLILIVAVFFSRGGPSTYVHDRLKRNTVGVFFAAGYISFGLMRFLTRVKSGGAHVVRDERDERIDRRANFAALFVALCFVFFTCIGLYEHYHDDGLVPVGWMWFLAYASVFLSYISGSVATLVLHAKRIG
jgi:hypothetical protein